MSSINVNTIKSRLGGPPTLPSGVVVSAAATFSTDVSIGGTLTYEDVTNVDAVGLITARNGIQFGAAGIGGTIRANGDTTLAGVVTATSFSGDGSALTGMASTDNVSTSTLNVVGIVTAQSGIEFGAAGVGGTVTAVGHAEFVGIVTVTQGTDLDGYKVEEGSYDTDALNGEFDFELENGHVQTHTGSTAGTYFPDFRVSSSQSLSSVMDVGDVVSTTLIVTASNTAHYCTTGIKIDNSTSNVTIEWIGSAAPTAGKGAGYDIYAFTIQKTAATPAYLVIVNATDAG